MNLQIISKVQGEIYEINKAEKEKIITKEKRKGTTHPRTTQRVNS
jgi:hypothetical protein